MDTLSYKTISANKETADKKWFVVDAEGQNVGRLASRIAKVLRGKHKTCYTPHADCGDNIIVLNASKVSFTGLKLTSKQYVTFSGYPSGQKFATASELLKKHPERIVEKAVKGMLPKNTLGRALYKNLKVYAGNEHNHDAQKPEVLNLNEL